MLVGVGNDFDGLAASDTAKAVSICTADAGVKVRKSS